MMPTALEKIDREIQHYTQRRGNRKYRDFGSMSPEKWDYLDGVIFGLEQAKISIKSGYKF